MRDDSLQPAERAEIALRKFGRLSDSEVVTPAKVADEMVSILPFNELNANKDAKFLDIAAKQGEFTIALYKTFGDKVKNNIYAIPTSKLTYELTRKVYSLLGMPIENIFAEFTSYDLIGDNNENIIKRLKDMNFDVVISNPPYQINDGSGASDDASNPIYQEFVKISHMIRPTYLSIIMPSKWMVGGKAILKPFRKAMMEDVHIAILVDYENDREVFPAAHNDGGICYFLSVETHNKGGILQYVYKATDGTVLCSNRTLKDGNSDIIIRDIRRKSIIEKSKGGSRFNDIVSARKPFGINTDLFNNTQAYPELQFNKEYFNGSAIIWGVYGIKGGAKRVYGYISKKSIHKKVEWIDKYKLFISKAYSTDAINPPALIEAGPNVVCTETFLVIGPFETYEEQQNCHKYVNTNYFKTLLFFGRGTMQVSQEVFRFIPMQDFTANSDIDWNKSITEIDAQLYAKYRLTADEIAFIESMIKPI